MGLTRVVVSADAKLIGDVLSATAILDRFLHHAKIITITGRSYRLRNQAASPEQAAVSASGPAPDKPTPAAAEPNAAISPAGLARKGNPKNAAKPPVETASATADACQSLPFHRS